MKIHIAENTYWLTRIVFFRAIAFIFFVAFLVAYNQNKELIGDDGLLPLKLHMKMVKSHVTDSWWHKIKVSPTLLWLAEPWDNVNPWLDNVALAGATLSALVFIKGAANMIVMFTIWVLYHSIVNVGQRWYGFGWESQLLETGFLAICGAPFLSLSALPRKSPMSWISVWGLRWLIVRIMLGAGLIKIRGDKCWSDFTCMNYHYETQPVPNPVSYYLHQSPEWVHVGETFGNHVVELIVPFFAFLPRRGRMTCGFVQILFQVILIISGNLSFLNWLTIVPSLAFFDDRALSSFFSTKTLTKVATLQREKISEGKVRRCVNILVSLVIAYLSVPVVVNLLSSRQIMNVSYDSFRIVNTYGAFGSITKARNEVTVFGTYAASLESPNVTWHEYEFKCKPGKVKRRPCVISPYHYRIDWLMWFAAFQKYDQNPWLLHMAGKLLTNDPGVTSLIQHNPFMGKSPPKFVKADLYHYKYTSMSEDVATKGQWYRRAFARSYFPPLDLKTLKPIFKEMGWKALKSKKK